jgi:hypothetical protein
MRKMLRKLVEQKVAEYGGRTLIYLTPCPPFRFAERGNPLATTLGFTLLLKSGASLARIDSK